jgi:hypothetical protein
MACIQILFVIKCTAIEAGAAAAGVILNRTNGCSWLDVLMRLETSGDLTAPGLLYFCLLLSLRFLDS